MSYTRSIEYSEAIIKIAAGYFLRRFLLPEIGVGVGSIAGALSLYITGYLSLEMALALAGAGTLLIVVAGVVAWKYVRHARRKFAALGGPRVEWTFSDTTFGSISKLGTVELPWSAVKKVWLFPEVWLLFFDDGGYSTLPTKQLGPQLQEFILQRLKQ
jgi:hypothetical protein